MNNNLVIQVPSKYRDAVNTYFSTSDLPSQIEKNKSQFDPTVLNFIPWGLDNVEPNKYLQMLEINSMLFRTLTVITSMIVGDGYKVEGRDKDKCEKFLIDIGVDNEFLNKCAWDLSLFNGLSILVNKNGYNEVVKVQHVKLETIRIGTPNRFGEYDCIYQAPDWTMIDNRGRLVNSKTVRKNKEYYEPEAYSTYSILNDDYRQMLYRRIINPAKTFYPLSPVATCYKSLELQNEIINFHLNSIRNGASSTFVLTYPMNQLPLASTIDGGNQLAVNQYKHEQSELNALLDDISNKVKGVQNAGRPLVLSYDKSDGETKPELKQFPSSDNDTKWNTLISLNEIQILTALGIPDGQLVGIPNATGFSSKAEEMLASLEIMRSNTIYPLQNLLRDTLNQIIYDYGYIDCKIEFMQSTPISTSLTIEEVINKIVTRNEYREYKLGLKPFVIDEIIDDVNQNPNLTE